MQKASQNTTGCTWATEALAHLSCHHYGVEGVLEAPKDQNKGPEPARATVCTVNTVLTSLKLDSF